VLDTEDGDVDESHTINLCPPMSELSAGRDKAIRLRLDDSPIGLQLLNESSILVDSNKTLHAKLTQSTVPVLVSDSSSTSSHSRELMTPSPEITYSPVIQLAPPLPRPSNSQPSRSPTSPGPAEARPSPSTSSSQPEHKRKRRRQNEIHVTLRRGGQNAQYLR